MSLCSSFRHHWPRVTLFILLVMAIAVEASAAVATGGLRFNFLQPQESVVTDSESAGGGGGGGGNGGGGNGGGSGGGSGDNGEFEEPGGGTGSPQPPLVPPNTGSGEKDSNVTIYFVVLDAGSSGTRALAYRFRLNRSSPVGLDYVSVDKKERKQGLSSFQRYPQRSKPMLKDLLNQIKTVIPQSAHRTTWAILRATAGFRLMDDWARMMVAREARAVLHQSGFLVPKSESESVRMLSGKDEAKYTWVAVNYLLGNFRGGTTKPIIEMGGGSVQVAFEQIVAEEGDADPMISADDSEAGTVTFSLLSGRSYRVHTHSYLGLGFKESVLRMVGYTTRLQLSQQQNASLAQFSTPCLAPRLAQNFSFGSVDISVVGQDGVSEQQRATVCAEKALGLVRKLRVHNESALAGGGPHWPLYGIGSVYFLTQYLGQSRVAPDIQPDEGPCKSVAARGLTCRAYTGSVGDLTASVGPVCRNPPRTDRHQSYYCISLAVVSALLKHGIGLPDAAKFTVLGESNGLSWTLGLGIDYLNNLPGNGSESAASQMQRLLMLTLLGTLKLLLR